MADNAKCGESSASKIVEGYLASSVNFVKSHQNIKFNGNSFYSDSETQPEIEAVELEDVETPILDALENFINNPSIPLHIPGHARGEGVLPKFRRIVGDNIINLDITDEFDNLGTLHPADGPIAKSQELTAQTFGAAKSFFLVNGSTVGNLALALTAAKNNKKVIINRNCHRSIVSGLCISGANPVWAIPERFKEWGIWGAIKPEEIERLLDENPDTTTVWITNPTYEGIVSDVAAIAAICKKKNVIFIVDEAHGCVWKFNKQLPPSALDLGADAVLHSMHKTGGSFSQSSVLHIGKNSKINTQELEANLRMLHTTSPSYLLLASLDAARAYLSTKYGIERLENAVNNANMARELLQNMPKVKCLHSHDGVNLDPTKIYVMIEGLSGKRLESILEIEYQIEVESAADAGILALSNIGNTKEELEYFCKCIESIANSDYSDITYLEKRKYMPFHTPQIICNPREAYTSSKEKISPKKSIGRISAEVIAECPPGIPILVPGEKITGEHIPFLDNRKSIWVIKEE